MSAFSSSSSSSTTKSAAASASASSFTHAFDNPGRDSASQHPLHHPSTIRNNLFVGTADDVMSKVRYRPVDTRSHDDDDDDGENLLHRRRKSKSPSVATSSFAASDDGFTDEQFRHSSYSSSSCKIPYKAIGLAMILFCLGTAMCVIGGLLLSGIYIDQKYNDRTWPVLCLGLIMFIPGAYHVRIAYYAWKRVPGFHYSDIPDWD